MADIYYPLEETGLLYIIPKDDKILYSGLCKAVFRDVEYTGTGATAAQSKWQTPVIFTDEGIAFRGNYGDQYVPWYSVKWFMRGRFYIGKTTFELDIIPEIETVEEFKIRKKKFTEKFKPMMKKIKMSTGMSYRGLKILLGTLGISFLVFMILFLSFGYHVRLINYIQLCGFDLISYFFQGDILFMTLISLAIGFISAWIIVSRIAWHKIQKYEKSKKSKPTCPNCGEILPEHGHFCVKCGTQV